ncbi:CHAT domain-containing protein [Aureispira anguillae]|nr:CHAT domain-containing tetratricopeptide repeat protein [Aureispira anguillae]
MFDSLMHYESLLVDRLTKEEDQASLVENGKWFIGTMLNSQQVSMAQKWALLQNTSVSKAWEYAYSSQLYWESEKQDSAYIYLDLLEQLTEKKEALIYAYGFFAKEFATKKNTLQKAFEYLNQAEQLLQTTSDSILLYANQATVYTAIGYFKEALRAGRAVVYHQLQNKYIDSVSLAFAYDRLAEIYWAQSNYEQAKRYAGEAINYMADRSGYAYQTASMWYRWASCYFNLENKPLETILYLRKVFSLLPKEEQLPSFGKMYIDACAMMALQFLEVKQLDSTQIYLDAAQKLQKKLAYKIGETEAIQAKLYFEKGELTLAERAFKEAVAATKKEHGSKSLLTAIRGLELGNYYKTQKKYKLANSVLEEAFWALSTVSKFKTFPAMHTICSRSNAIQILRSKIETMLILYEKSKYNVSLKDIYSSALYNLDLLRKVSNTATSNTDFLTFSVSVYEQAIEACELLFHHNQEQHYLHEAFQLAEESKVVLLQKMMEEPKAQKFGGVSPKLIQAELELQGRMVWYQQRYWEAVLNKDSLQMNWYQEQMASFDADLEGLKEELKITEPKYYQFKYQNSIASLDSIQQTLSDSTILVQYLEGSRSIYQFIICKDTLAVRKIFWRTYKPTILKYYKHFTHPKLKQHSQSGGFKDFCITSYELYHKLMHHELLSSGKRLVIIPDGLLNYIPFGTLLTDIPLDNVHKINFPQLAYLLKEKQIAYNYSSSLWLREMNHLKAPINHEILGMAATYTDEKIAGFRAKKWQKIRSQLTQHEGRDAEMDSLSNNYAGDFYTDRYATEYYLKDYAADYGILHLAIYGIIDPEFPEYSSLIFAEDAYEKEDNFLTINEIKQLNLNTDMVVLSNCQTGYGPYQRGEGLISLGRSFMYAGSPAVVLSLWEQNDESTPILMDYFYENLKHKIDKDEALRQAKLRYLKSTKGLKAHPVYWAGFITVGNYQAIEVEEPVVYIWWFIIPIAFLGFLGWWSMQALRQRR